MGATFTIAIALLALLAGDHTPAIVLTVLMIVASVLAGPARS